LERRSTENHAATAGAESAPGPSFFPALAGLVRNPGKLLFLWNWKAATLSIILRAPIFVGAAFQRGFNATASAFLTESLFCMATAGFYGAIVQNLRDAEPQWLTGLFIAIVLPAIFQVLEFLLHWFRGTPHLRMAELVSIVVSGLSALFNWYAMRRGVLLVGREGERFGADIRRLPRLIAGFVTLPLRRQPHQHGERPQTRPHESRWRRKNSCP
jgi:hypothetical protein